MAKKYDLRLHKVDGDLRVRTETYGNGTASVYGHIETTIEIDSYYMMRIIEENWSSIDPEQRHAFARKIAAHDFQDTLKTVSAGPQEAEEKGFKW